ncbi:hypothetical protein T484DRAFT_1833447 [Baffinella frigidus]|nr:hypothetical protein T484DRAFT_1833447 [Cryptophyta sp. CCMP2293]
MGSLSLSEQLRSVQGVHGIAGIHGNGLAVAWFAHRGAALIDIQPHATTLPGR